MSRVASRAAVDARRVVELRCVKFASALQSVKAFESVSRQSPKRALGPTLLGLKRAAEAKKCQRIAGRLAALAGARQAGADDALDWDDPDRCWRTARPV
jgi:hypothetical protein